MNISPDYLLNISGYSPANNLEGYKTNVPFVSKIIGGNIRYYLQYKNILGSIQNNHQLFGPISTLAGFQKNFLDFNFTKPITVHAKKCAIEGKNPDTYVVINEEIENKYAKLLYEFSGEFIKDGKFNRTKARDISKSFHGDLYLINKMRRFLRLELNYLSVGLTGLAALKELLSTILIAITEKPVSGSLPYTKNSIAIKEYVEDSYKRIENLYKHNAFNIKKFSESFTKGKIGYLDFEIMKDSQLGSLSLRYYSAPKKNGKVFYLASPLINKPEIFDLAKDKSVVEGLINMGFDVYLQDPGEANNSDSKYGLGFYGKEVHDKYFSIIKNRHKDSEIFVMGYCMGGTLVLPYLARRAQERIAEGKDMDVKKVVLMASPFKFDDSKDGQKPMRGVISKDYDKILMDEMYGEVNVPPQIIEVGMNEIQPGVRYYVRSGFYGRASFKNAIEDSAPFLYWLTHGTKFPAQAHQEWIKDIFVGNKIYNGSYCLPSRIGEFNNKPVDMNILKKANVTIFDYKGTRDPISPSETCVAGDLWGVTEKNVSADRGGLNRVIEKNIGHIFVVSKKLLKEYLDDVQSFLDI
jgi:poly(3-hydroxyalkanoate) synthetase